MSVDAINPFLLLIVVGCGCGLLVLRESPKAAKAFSHWCFQHQAGREGYQKAREEYREKNGLAGARAMAAQQQEAVNEFSATVGGSLQGWIGRK